MFPAVQAPPGGIDRLLDFARGGDAAAFTDLIRRYEAMVFGLACHFLHDRSAAEDLAQEVFLELYRNVTRIESEAHLTFWLRRVTCHRCIDQSRRQRYRTAVPADEAPEPSESPAARDLFLEERLRRAVAELPPQARLIVALRYQEDLEPSEIADVLGVSVNTVKSRLRRSLAVLRARMSHGRGGHAF